MTMREDAGRIMEVAIQAVLPDAAVQRALAHFALPEGCLVLVALGKPPAPGFAALDALNTITGVPVPKNLAAIRDLPVLHTDAVEKRDMLSYVKEAIR